MDFVYDIEVYPNVFTCSMLAVDSGKTKTFEISERQNDIGPFIEFINRLGDVGGRMIGYNNLHYDYPVVHHILTDLKVHSEWQHLTHKIKQKSDEIINAPHQQRFAHVVWDSQQIVQQIDLLKVHHFDNVARATSLKVLEFNMRMEDIEDLPFTPDTHLTPEQTATLVGYNRHDVRATYLFWKESESQVRFRETLSTKYDRNFLNHNDTKIGKDYFVMQLERQLGKQACFTREGGRRKPRQTLRDQIAVADVIFDYVSFETEPFQAVKGWLEDQVITETKGVFTDLSLDQMIPFIEHSPVSDEKKVRTWLDNGCLDTPPKVAKPRRRLSVMQDGVEFVFGTGGIHASVHNSRIESTDERVIVDLDVKSYYPNLSIANRIYPAHLGEQFCDIYEDMYQQRSKFPKGTPENAMLKLALNGVYGDSNNKFSPFFDPFYTMSITVNGQLLLCMLYEQLRKIESVELIQVNTDGLTVSVDRSDQDKVMSEAKTWEETTGLILEDAVYDTMFIRDVNNYVAVYSGGGVKRKGAYEYDIGWHQNHSALIVPKAAEAAIVHGTDIEEFVLNHEDTYDFMLRAKVPRSSTLVGDWGLGIEETLQNVSRYYIAKDGPELVKIMPPTPKKPDVWRHIGINIGCPVAVCNHTTEIDPELIDYDWYINEARKLAELGE
jgi:hypothetical protein